MTSERDRSADVARAWVLPQDGASVRQVAEAPGCSVSTAHARIREAADAEQVIGSEDRSTARIREAAALSRVKTAEAEVSDSAA